MEPLNLLISMERNEMHNHIDKENVELQIDSCNKKSSESYLPLCSTKDSETNNVQTQSESVTVEECLLDFTNRQRNVDPPRDHCY